MSTGAVEQTATEPSPADKGLRVLLAYASKYGSTKGVADRIAARLRALGNRVELHHADVAPDVSEYDAVIFGSPAFNQRWLPEAEQFARRNRQAIASRPVWLFSVVTAFSAVARSCRGLEGP